MERFKGAQDTRDVVEATDDINEVVAVVSRHRKVLARHEHFGCVHQFALVVDYEATVTSQC